MIHLDAFVHAMQERDLFPKERNRVVVACSGGADSLCLLYLLWGAREGLNLDLSVLTCDHGLRPESRAEALEVQQRAWSLGLPCAFRPLRVQEEQRGNESVEMTARRLRRETYAKVAEEFEADQVALGHHLDDQAETILLRLLRGTGPRGAGGMTVTSELSSVTQLVRPLLSYRRKEIESTLLRWRQRPVHDPSNWSREHTRNRVRLDVMPLLEEINPGVVQHVCDFAEDQQKLEAWAGSEARAKAKTCVEEEAIHLEPLRFLPDVLRERIVLGWYRDRGGQPDQVPRAAWKPFFAELERVTPHSRSWELGGMTLQVENDILTAGHPPSLSDQVLPFSGGETLCESIGRKLKIEQVHQLDQEASAHHQLEGRLTGYIRIPDRGIRVRPMSKQDRYRPLGMNGRVRLVDVLSNAKVPRRLRSVWPVVSVGDEIVWVPGFRVAEQWKVTEFPCLRLRLEAGRIHTFCG